MFTGLADLVAGARAGGTGAPLAAGPPVPPATDEVAMMSLIRLLNQVGGGTLSPVDRAFLTGARAMFTELAAVCDALLKGPPAGPPAAPDAEPVHERAVAPPPRPAPGTRSVRGRQKPPDGPQPA